MPQWSIFTRSTPQPASLGPFLLQLARDQEGLLSALDRDLVDPLDRGLERPASLAGILGVAADLGEIRVFLERLGQQLPALDMGEEVSLALASLATQSANDMLGGLLTIPEGFANQRRGSIRAQMEPNLPQTLAYVYRDLTDAQLNAYADWSETDSGQAFFRASSAAARDALNP